DESEKCNYQYVVVEVNEEATTLNRDEILMLLQAENILARRYFFPGCHRMEPYRSYFPNAYLMLANTNILAGRVLVLPTGTAVGAREIVAVCRILKLALHNPLAVRKLLRDRGLGANETSGRLTTA
ncbi:MAG TPA: DegT/DnrJ/EryC1/StrS family aminotransferase, partial [Bryobacteraceae bacterium]|nr:DegT/DnrJ/EryC1/StrS family aminotransferase [Bryobacteraceae bacterium]